MPRRNKRAPCPEPSCLHVGGDRHFHTDDDGRTWWYERRWDNSVAKRYYINLKDFAVQLLKEAKDDEP